LAVLGQHLRVQPAQLAAFFLQTKMKQTVSLTAMPVNEGIAQLAVGSLDVFIGVRLPAVDAATLKQHESKIQDLGAVFRGFGAGLLVPVSAAPVTIADLAGQESAFQNKLVLINGGEDVEAAVRSALTAYGLNFTVETLPEAEAVAQAKQAIAGKTAMLLASSLPRWELSRLRLRTLDDPKLALGELQRLHVFSRAKFQRDMKDAAGFMRRFKLLDRQLVTLIDDINKNSADPAAGAALWCEQHPKLVEQWLPREMKIQLGLIDPEKEPGNSGAARGDKPGAPADTGEAGK